MNKDEIIDMLSYYKRQNLAVRHQIEILIEEINRVDKKLETTNQRIDLTLNSLNDKGESIVQNHAELT